MKAKRVGFDVKTIKWLNNYGEERQRIELHQIFKDEDGNCYSNHLDNIYKLDDEDSEEYKDWTKGMCTN